MDEWYPMGGQNVFDALLENLFVISMKVKERWMLPKIIKEIVN